MREETSRWKSFQGDFHHMGAVSTPWTGKVPTVVFLSQAEDVRGFSSWLHSGTWPDVWFVITSI